MDVAVIIAAAGRGARLGSAVPKQFLPVGDRSLLRRSIEAFAAVPRVGCIAVVVPADLVEEAAAHVPGGLSASVRIVAGGPRRQDSVGLGLHAVPESFELILVHDAARAFVSGDVIGRTIDAAERHGAAIAAIATRDTLKRARRDADGPVVAATLPRDDVYLAQTPQGFRRDVLEAAIRLGDSGVDATDEARLAELAGFDVRIVDGDPRNLKVTTSEDLSLARALANASRGAHSGERGWRPADMRIGFGYDSHRLVEGRPLVLGGVTLPFEKGLAGHSDADAVAHAVTDAVLGAAALDDIGVLFPDTDPRWKDANSLELLGAAAGHARVGGFDIVNVDVTVIAERPKLQPYRDGMRRNLARALGIPAGAVSVKGKTNEGVDAAGRGEAIVVHAVALLAAAAGGPRPAPGPDDQPGAGPSRD
jgi:2-C-methyl-D-erythritol 4-phosphate cytidylyltransferase/2-C-methyl-D-erythritol 2,4-cyclodiphosphate synthase